MSAIFLLVLCPAFFAIAAFFSMLGLGGGVIYTPLQLACGIDFHHASATSLLLIFLSSLSAARIYGKNGKIDWPLILLLGGISVVGSFTGALVSSSFSDRTLALSFSLILFLAAYLMYQPLPQQKESSPRHPRLGFWQREIDGRSYVVNLFLALPLSFVSGALGALLGVGGGTVIVPMLVILFLVPIDIAIGCSTIIVAISAAAAVFGHILENNLELIYAVPLGLITLFGGSVGAKLSIEKDRTALRRSFAYVLMPIAVIVVAKVFDPSARPPSELLKPLLLALFFSN